LPLTVRFETVRALTFAVEAKRLVEDAVVAKKFVVVAAVPVAFWKVKFWRVEEPVARIVPAVSVPIEPRVEKKLVDDATEAKKVVEVAFEVVAFCAVKFWRVVELRAIRVPVAVIFAAVRFEEKKPVPTTEKVVNGVVVPIPILPFWILPAPFDSP